MNVYLKSFSNKGITQYQKKSTEQLISSDIYDFVNGILQYNVKGLTLYINSDYKEFCTFLRS